MATVPAGPHLVGYAHTVYICLQYLIRFLLFRSGAPIFEVPKDSYTGEQILKILLNPVINKDKICKECPRQILQSSTFVVDMDKLKHPDDVKKDEFGKWKFSGSHVKLYKLWKLGESMEFEMTITDAAHDTDVFQLRRIRCSHPSSPSFQRLLAFVTGM